MTAKLFVVLPLILLLGCTSDEFAYIAGADLEARCRVVYHGEENHRRQHVRLRDRVVAMSTEELSLRAKELDVYELSAKRRMMGRPKDEKLLPYYIAYEVVRRAMPTISASTTYEKRQELGYLINNARSVQLAGGRVQTYISPNNRHYCKSFLGIIAEELDMEFSTRLSASDPYGTLPAPLSFTWERAYLKNNGEGNDET